MGYSLQEKGENCLNFLYNNVYDFSNHWTLSEKGASKS
jgi:hypothetical protein